MKGRTKIIVGIIVIVIVILVFVGIWQYIESGFIGDGATRHVMDCEMDLANKTLKVTNVEKVSYFEWSDIEVIWGNATLPTGFIDKGDIITNCSGEVKLVYKPFNLLLGEWIFEE